MKLNKALSCLLVFLALLVAGQSLACPPAPPDAPVRSEAHGSAAQHLTDPRLLSPPVASWATTGQNRACPAAGSLAPSSTHAPPEGRRAPTGGAALRGESRPEFAAVSVG